MNTIFAILAISFLPYFEARNQVANFVITPPDAGQEVKPEKPNLMSRDKCPACAGAGELKLEEPNFGQANGRIGNAKKINVKCALCKGRGTLEAFMLPANMTVQVARDREEYISRHQAKGEIQVGEAFVPNDVYQTLDKNKLKLIENAFGKPCQKCLWTGVEACKKCNGNGIVKCPETDCKGGFLVTKTTTEKTRTSSGGSSMRGNSRGGIRSSGSRRTSTKETKVNVQVCPTCGGTKQIVCAECGGRRAHPCKKCNGLGVKQKAGSL